MSWRSEPELVLDNGRVIGWLCQCKSYNDILTRLCWNCRTQRDSRYDDIEASIVWNRSLVWTSDMKTLSMMDNDERKQLHVKFFNSKRIFVRDMDNFQLRAHREELELIAFEARSYLTAIDAEERERNANGKRDKNWLVSTGNDPNVTDAIEVVKERKARMSKADKMAEQFKNLGLPAEQVAALMSNIAKTATDKSLNPTFNKGETLQTISELCRTEQHGYCPGKFHNEKGSFDCNCKCHSAAIVTNSEPFDPSKLFS